MRKHGHGLGSTDGVHLVDSKHGAQRQNVRMRQTVEFGLRWGRDGDSTDAGNLCWHHVHDDAGGQRCEPARHVQTNALHRDVAQPDARAGRQLGGGFVVGAFQPLSHHSASLNG